MIKLYSGVVDEILKKHPSDVLLNFTDLEGTAHSRLGRVLYRDYPEYGDIIERARSSNYPITNGMYGYQKDANGVTHISAFVEQLKERVVTDDLKSQNLEIYNNLMLINHDMLKSGSKSIMLQYFGSGMGWNFADFLTVLEEVFDPSITVRLITAQHIAKYCQLPHYHYPEDDVEKDILC